MIIKPLERKTSQTIFLKTLFLITLIAIGILLEKVLLQKSHDIPSILGKTREIKLPTQEKLIKEAKNNDLVKDSTKKVEEVSGAVLGEATDILNKLSSDAGSFVSNVIYNNSIGKVVEQIDKLPKDQQEKIREQICK